MGSDGAPKGTPTKQMVMPVCGLASHEEGIQLLRACLATAREDPTYGGTETQSESPVWGCNDDWALLRPELEKRTAPLSPKLPPEVMALPAAFFRDPTFAVPDPEQDCVVAFGGVANVEGAGAGGCHFMPLLTQRQAHSWHSSTSAHEKWRDMVLAVEGRGDGLLLVDRVREAGDCYFHSLLITLHAKGILFRAAASNESTPPPRQARLSTSPPSSQEPGGNRRGLCFDDALAEEEVVGYSMEDPVEGWVEKLKAIKTAENLEDVLFPNRIFEGLRNKAETYDTVKGNLKMCWEDTRTHRQLAVEEDMDIRLCAVGPIADAVHAIARAKGVHTEALLVCLDSNIGFLEANGTTLCHNPRAQHFIPTGSPVIVGSPSSTRKTALIQQTDDWMCNAPHAGQAFQDRSVLTTDSTTKGIRNCLKDYGRCGVTSDEAANTFDTRMSDRESGIHFIAVTKLNTWTQGEPDAPTTGNGSFSLTHCNFLLKVAGQTEVVEEVVQPRVHGFQKRLKQVWSLSENPTQDQDQLFKASDKLIQDWHDWMHSKCVEQPPVVISLSGQALSMYNAAKQAITDFVSENKLPPVFRTKLVFFHSDVLRDAHKVFRSVQFLTTLCPNLPEDSREAISLDEFTVALHKWIRQIQWHFGSYRFAASKKDEAAAGLSSNSKAAESKQILCSIPETEEQAPLDAEALFLRTLMHRAPPDAWFTSADMRLLLKNLRGTTFKSELSKRIEKGVGHLIDHGLLEAGEAKMK